jgi:hypothetical protein
LGIIPTKKPKKLIIMHGLANLKEFFGIQIPVTTDTAAKMAEKITVQEMDQLLVDIETTVEAHYYLTSTTRPRTHAHGCDAQLRLVAEVNNGDHLVYAAKCVQSHQFSNNDDDVWIERYTDGMRDLWIGRNGHDQSLYCPGACGVRVS